MVAIADSGISWPLGPETWMSASCAAVSRPERAICGITL